MSHFKPSTVVHFMCNTPFLKKKIFLFPSTSVEWRWRQWGNCAQTSACGLSSQTNIKADCFVIKSEQKPRVFMWINNIASGASHQWQNDRSCVCPTSREWGSTKATTGRVKEVFAWCWSVEWIALGGALQLFPGRSKWTTKSDPSQLACPHCCNRQCSSMQYVNYAMGPSALWLTVLILAKIYQHDRFHKHQELQHVFLHLPPVTVSDCDIFLLHTEWQIWQCTPVRSTREPASGYPVCWRCSRTRKHEGRAEE